MSRFVRLAALPILLGGLAPVLGGCGYDPTYYQLTAEPGAAQAGGPGPVEVRTVSFPSTLDRDQIVTRAGTTLTLDKHAAWSEAPGTQIGRVLASDLAQRLPGSTVFAQESATATDAAVLVEFNVTSFNADEHGQVALAGSLSVHGKGDGPFTAVPVRLTAPAGGGTAGLVTQLSRLVGQLADQAAAQIRLLPPALLPTGSVAAGPIPITPAPPVPPGVSALAR